MNIKAIKPLAQTSHQDLVSFFTVLKLFFIATSVYLSSFFELRRELDRDGPSEFDH